jgi:DNA invertase Pin-like site-specific DNA recombinase
MSRIGYARVSTGQQTNDPQLDRLNQAGCERIFTDVITGKLASRPEWDKCREFLRKGDVLVIVRLDRIGRSVRNLIEVVNSLGERGIDLQVLDQAIDTTTPVGKFMFHVLAAIAEFERDLIRERTMDGLAAARARGRKGGRKQKLNPRQETRLYEMYDSREFTGDEIAGELGIHRTVVYDYVRRRAGVPTGGVRREPGRWRSNAAREFAATIRAAGGTVERAAPGRLMITGPGGSITIEEPSAEFRGKMRVAKKIVAATHLELVLS